MSDTTTEPLEPTDIPPEPDLAPSDAEGEIEKVIQEAKKTFTFADKLRGIRASKSKVLIFQDVAAVQAWGEANQKAEKLAALAERQEDQDAKGDVIKRYNEAEEEAERLKAAMYEGALAFHLRSLPNVALKVARRDSRAAFVVDGQIPADRAEDHQELFNLLLMKDVIEVVKDAHGGEYKPTADELKTLSDQLDPTQWGRLVAEMNTLLFFDGIADAATNDPGF